MNDKKPAQVAYAVVSAVVGVVTFVGLCVFFEPNMWVWFAAILSGNATYALLRYLANPVPLTGDEELSARAAPSPKSNLRLGETPSAQTLPMQLHLLKKSGAKVGPCSGQKAMDMISAGELGWDDLCWKEGMAEWAPLHTVLERPAHVPPPPPRAASTPPPPPPAFRAEMSATPAPSAATVSPGQRIDAGALFFGYGMCVAAGFFMESSGAHPAMLVLVALAAMAVFAVLHYQCWKHVPVQYRQMDPAKAVGLMLIPLFNFYWAFVALPALAESMNRWAAGRGTATRSAASLVTLAQVYATVSVVSLAVTIFEPFPVVIFLAYAAELVCFVWFFRAVIGVQHRLAVA